MDKNNHKLNLSSEGPIERKSDVQKGRSYLISQKKWLLQAIVLSVVGFIILKYCFPVPDINDDGINYISWAYNDTKMAYRPLAYVYFLEMIHSFTTSIGAVVIIQFIIHVISQLFALFSVDYIFVINPRVKQLLIVFTSLNPLLLIQCNNIASDSLFCSLTILLITLLIWFARKPDWRLFIAVVSVLYFCIALRLTAMFFPFLFLVTIILCKAKLHAKLLYAGAVIAVVAMFVQNQKDTAWRETGVSVFSGFSGWQIANNALYCYKKIHVENKDLPSLETRRIDSAVKYLIDSVPTPDEVGVAYLWHQKSPLRMYTIYNASASKQKYFLSWMMVSEDLSEYGWYIIRNNPYPFIRYYIYPNLKRFFYPEPSPLDNYNAAKVKLPAEVGLWFNWPAAELRCRFPELQRKIISVYPPLCLLLNISTIVVIIFFLVKAIPTRTKLPHAIWILFWTWSAFYFGFMAFSVFASAIYLRFLEVIFALSPVFSIILLSWALKISGMHSAMKPQSSQDEEFKGGD